MLMTRAELLGLNHSCQPYHPDCSIPQFEILHVDCPVPVIPGRKDHRHADYIINTLNRGIAGCLNGEFNALITGPINKNLMQCGGFDFMGHTEYLASKTGAEYPVMLLMSETLRVALVTTHLPLSEVPKQITGKRIITTTRILHQFLVEKCRLKSPLIGICGLNPHAGEGGRLGHEEITEIIPAIEILIQEGIKVAGPLPADTIFTRHHLVKYDAILAMYHDQGLPVIKHGHFGATVNVTLGLPIIRTSVDHGTAYDLAGRGMADTGSLQCALMLAEQLAAGSIH